MSDGLLLLILLVSFTGAIFLVGVNAKYSRRDVDDKIHLMITLPNLPREVCQGIIDLSLQRRVAQDIRDLVASLDRRPELIADCNSGYSAWKAQALSVAEQLDPMNRPLDHLFKNYVAESADNSKSKEGVQSNGKTADSRGSDL